MNQATSNLIGFEGTAARYSIVLAPSTNPFANVPNMECCDEYEADEDFSPEEIEGMLGIIPEANPETMSLADRATLREDLLSQYGEPDYAHCAHVMVVNV
ncbi:hypothetical protein ACFL1U_00775 [Patescibacteria group bacterium]